MAEDEDAPDVYQQLAQLGALKARLDEVDAEIGDLIPAVESALDSLQLGVPVSLEIATGERWIEFLSFSKVNKKWRLCLDLSPEDPLDADEWKSTPLSDIPRDRRAFILAEYLPMFLKAAASAVKQKIELRRRAIEAAQNLVSMVATYREDVGEEEAPKEQSLSLLHQVGLSLATSSGDASASAGAVTFAPPLGQTLPAVTLPGELPGPPAVPVKPRLNDVPSSPVSVTVVVSKPKGDKPGRKL